MLSEPSSWHTRLLPLPPSADCPGRRCLGCEAKANQLQAAVRQQASPAAREHGEHEALTQEKLSGEGSDCEGRYVAGEGAGQGWCAQGLRGRQLCLGVAPKGMGDEFEDDQLQENQSREQSKGAKGEALVAREEEHRVGV